MFAELITTVELKRIYHFPAWKRPICRTVLGVVVALASACCAQPNNASAAFVQMEVQDWDQENGPDDLSGNQLYVEPAGFTPIAGLGGLKPSGTGGGKMLYMGQTTERANAIGQGAPANMRYERTFTIPNKVNGFSVSTAILLYDFVFLTDDLGDFGAGESDFEDDDYFRAYLDGTDILKVDSDQVFIPGTVVGLTPPLTNSDPAEATGFEKRTGWPGVPWLTSAHDVTNKAGNRVTLGFEVADPFLISPVGESLESGMMIDEIRLVLFYETQTAWADFDDDGTVDQEDLAIWKEGYGTNLVGDADFDEDADGQDFLIWQRQLSIAVAATALVHAVPEPNTVLLGLLAVVCGVSRRARPA